MADDQGTSEVGQLCQAIQGAVFQAMKTANSLPISEFPYYNSFESFSKIMKVESNSTLSMMTSLINLEQIKRRSIDKVAEDDDKFDLLCDVNDMILDRFGHIMDDACGLKKKDEELIIATLNTSRNMMSTTQSVASWNKKPSKPRRDGVYNLITAKSVQRPQLKFDDKINNSHSPFVPVIKYKANLIKPLAILPELDDKGCESFAHPYEWEIEKFQVNDELLKQRPVQEAKSLNETPLTMVATEKDLAKMCSILMECKEIAVDLEHHSYRSYQGFTCLMQISTRNEDFIIDTLTLRSHLHCLNEIFTNQKILKVFHGADMDILWLQRDFGVYVVNMFDTGQASRVLNMAHFSLAFLMNHYLHKEMNKRFQLADWRIRPIPEEMIRYGREDTHYLLYIYDRMCEDLIAKGNSNSNLLKSVFDRSKLVCLKKYEKPTFSDIAHLNLLKKGKMIFNSQQLHALKELYKWRDDIARMEDESIGYVLPNHMILQIAEVLPREKQGILACCNPVPPFVKQQLNELHLIILKAREQPLHKEHDESVSSICDGFKNVDVDSLVVCRHDVAHLNDAEQYRDVILNFQDNEVVINRMRTEINVAKVEPKSLLSFFLNKYESKLEKVKIIERSFTSPYQRYKNNLRKLEEANAKKAEDQLNRVHAHFKGIASQRPVSIPSSGNEESRVSKSRTDVDMVDDRPIRETRKGAKKYKAKPDIPCNSVASALHMQMESKGESSNFNANTPETVPSVPPVEPFDYESYDYSKFSAKTSGKRARRAFTASTRGNKGKGKRKSDKSHTFGANKKFKRN